jgi:arylsulfatase A-like enzyme
MKNPFICLLFFHFCVIAKGGLSPWVPTKDIGDFQQNESGIRLLSTGADPILMSEGVAIDPATVNVVVVEMRSSASGFAELFWSRGAVPQMHPASSLRVPVRGTGQRETLRFDVANHPSWQGAAITHLRFDPINQSGVEIAIESISFPRQTTPTPYQRYPRGIRRHVANADGRPNIIFLLTDDQRWDSIGVNNPDLTIQTPAIDRLAREGINFVNGFVTTPICAVSRASIISGRHTRNHRVHCFLIPFPQDVFATSYPVVMKEGGYFIGQLGKYGVGATGRQMDFFDFFDGDLAQGEAYKDYQGERVHDSEWLTRRTRDFLDAVPDGQPFVLQVNYKAPHPSAAVAAEDEGTLAGVNFPPQPADRPEYGASLPKHVRQGLGAHAYQGDFGTPDRRNAWIRRYLEKIISVDRSIGVIVEELEARGLADNTVIVFLSDHGTHFGERQLTAKWTPFDPSLKVPFIIYDPRARETAGTVREELVLNLDIAPTFIELAGLPVPKELDGLSLLPFLKGQPPTSWREHFFFEHQTAPATVPRPIPRHMGVRTEKEKFVRWTDPQPPIEEFYDLAGDPLERFNTIERHPERADRLRQLFDQWERDNPDTYTFMSYTHRPQMGNPDINFEKLKQALPTHFERIRQVVEEMGVTWEQAKNDPEIRWQVGVRAQFFY